MRVTGIECIILHKNSVNKKYNFEFEKCCPLLSFSGPSFVSSNTIILNLS